MATWLSSQARPRVTDWLAQWLRRRRAAMALILALIGLMALLVHHTGGPATASVSLMLVPVLLAGYLLGLGGGLAAGLLAGLLLGPMMPADSVSVLPLATPQWLIRVAVYALLGALAGWLSSRLAAYAQHAMERSRHHPVTALPNRQSLEEALRRRFRSGRYAEDTPRPLALVSVQVNNYPAAIRALGFSAETPLLQGMAARLDEVAAQADATLFHINDDHLALMLPQRSHDEAVQIAGLAVDSLQRAFHVHGVPVYLGANAGISIYPRDERHEPTRLLTKAWLAMQHASIEAIRCGSYEPHIEHESRHLVRLLGQFQQALNAGDLFLHYQPRVAISDQRVLGVEALIRWAHPDRGTVSPDQFVPAAERTGLIHPMTRWVFEQVSREVTWLRARGIDLRVGVNVSARDFQDPDFAEHLLAILDSAGLRTADLEVEFTESALMRHPDRVIDQLRRLRRAGLHLALDDFGTGYSSLAYLKQLPISSVKIDQTFIQGLVHTHVDARITQASIRLARELGMVVIAEGVESARTIELLRGMGCDALQGYGIARPMALDALPGWLHQWQMPEPPTARSGQPM